jgi:PAS domain S-box-containing protein
MSWFPVSFSKNFAGDLLVPGSWNYLLVALSVLVAAYASFIALQVTDQARRTHNPRRQRLTIMAASLALGGGIWSMHFIGMLAFRLEAAIGYDFRITLISITPAVLASWLALTLISREKIGNLQLLLGGIFVGAGIGTMHYTGMAAMDMTMSLHYEPLVFALSIIVAVILAIISLSIRFRLSDKLALRIKHLHINMLSSLVMGLAISGMHYTGMAAARFTLSPELIGSTGLASASLSLALGISVVAITISSLVLTINLLYKYRDATLLARKNASRLQATMATAIDAIISFDRDGHVIRANQAITSMLGWEGEQVKGESINKVLPFIRIEGEKLCIHDDGRSEEKPLIDDDCETVAISQGGESIPVRLAVGYSELDDESFFVAFISDLSQRVAMENELRHARDKAERAAKVKEMFLASMSHEIRTPMNAVIGFSDILLKDKSFQGLQQKHLNTINSSARSLLHLLDDILDTAKLEQGKVELSLVNFSLKEEIGQLISTLWVQADAKGLDLISNCSAALEDYYYGAPDKLRQILTNLIGNAIKFTERGQVILSVRPSDDNRVYFEVTDTGIGIPADRLESIFTPYNQADSSVSRRFGGTGLGTTISKQLVELMGGRIQVNSEPGVGSQFYFDIPLQAGSKVEVQTTENVSRLPALTILVADDAPFNLDLMEAILQEQGHSMIRACDGLEAVKLFRSRQPDLILMDIQMPNLDGLDASKQIRSIEAQQALAATPIIALTAGVFAQNRDAAIEAGMDGFVNKPVDAPTLNREMARVINADKDADTSLSAKLIVGQSSLNPGQQSPAQ